MCEACSLPALELANCLSCSDSMCNECAPTYILQPNGKCISPFTNCDVGPDFYTTTINNTFACP